MELNAAPTGRAQVREIAALVGSQAGTFVRTRLALTLGLAAAVSVNTALAPLILKDLVDRFAHGQRGASVPVLIGLYALSQWVARILGALREYCHAQADRRMYRMLSDHWLQHVMSLPLRFHLERQTGALSETLTNGLRGCQMLLQNAVQTLVPVTIEFIAVAVVLVSFHHFAFLLLFAIALACYGVVFAYGTVRVTTAARVASQEQVQSRAAMTDQILNYEIVKHFAAEPLMRERFGETLQRTESAWLRFFKSRLLNDCMTASIFSAFLALTLLYAAWRLQEGGLTLGDFVLVNTYAFQLVRPIEMLGAAAQGLSQSFVYLEKMMEVFNASPEPRASSSPVVLEGAGELTFDQVSVAYQRGRAVLKEVSFTVSPGSTVALVGASGAGKSTVLRLLMRLLEPDSGHILLDGVPLTRLSLPQLRSAIAVVPQETLLFNDTLRYNIGFGKWGSTQEEIERAARLACLHEFILSLPQGYDTRVGERGIKLSGGERQRVSIARALLKRPQIIVLDEPTSSLDGRTERAIQEHFQEIFRHSTTLVIAHRLSTILHADQIVVLEEGRVVEQGTHEQLLRVAGSYAALYESQQSGRVVLLR